MKYYILPNMISDGRLNWSRYLTFLGLYIGFGAVCVGVFKYEPPAGVWSTKSKVELRIDVSLLELLVGGRWGFRYCNVIMNCHRYIHVLYDNELNSRIYTRIRFWGPEILLLIPRLCLTWCNPAAHSCAFKTIYGDRSLWFCTGAHEQIVRTPAARAVFDKY